MPETEFANVTFADVRRSINVIAQQRGEWGGYPQPIQGKKLVIEPRYPIKRLNGFSLPSDDEVPREVQDDDFKLVNSWFSICRNSEVFIFREADGRITSAQLAATVVRCRTLIDVIEVTSQAWELEAELEAQEKLRSLVTETAWKHYVLIGMFLETSKRSNVTYLFRKLRTTVALGRGKNESVKAIATLCLHPIGYYEGTPCGVMVPTDDVIAHLLMMRGDEHMFWRKANQKPIWMENQ